MRAENPNGWQCSECLGTTTEAELCDHCGAVICRACQELGGHRKPIRMPTEVERKAGEWMPRYDGSLCG